MTPDIAILLIILLFALVLFITEWVRMDLVALMVLSSVAIVGLVSPTEAVSGFSNPAVITVWAMFIMSEGLTRAGIADYIGRNVLSVAGNSEVRMIAIFMLVGGFLSAFMNNIGVAALMLPVVVEVGRRAGVESSRLLMPMAYGTLLGGLMTLIGTPPNLLVSVAMSDAGFDGFSFFDFTFIGLPVLLAGTAFVALAGRHLLPRVDTTKHMEGQRELRAQYGLQERIYGLRIPALSMLEGKTLADTGLTSAAGLLIVAMTRQGRTEALPGRHTVLKGGDVLLAQGRLDRFELLQLWSTLAIEREAPMLQRFLLEKSTLKELVVAENSSLIGEPLRHRDFRERFAVNVLAIRRSNMVRRTRLTETKISAKDRLLVQCSQDALKALEKSTEFDVAKDMDESELREAYQLEDRLFVLRVPRDSSLTGTTLGDNRLGDAFDFRLLCIFRENALIDWPSSEESLKDGDLLLIQGRQEDLDVLRGLQQLELLEGLDAYHRVFEQGQLDLVEAALHPRAALSGKSVADLKLDERYQLQVAALWRDGKPYRSALNSMQLQRGDALLIVGPRHNLARLNTDQNLIVLNPVYVQPVDSRKAPLAGLLMILVVGSVIAGFLSIAVAAVAGATLMVLTGCLNMEQAYRSIDWRSIFLIAGMLPLGIAMQKTGAAEYLAGGVLALLGPYGPWPVIAGLYAVTAIGTLIIPTAALVLLMAPIALSASAELGILPHAPIIAVALAASASLASPVSHPANVLIMGPGGYRFIDYLKLGLPLTLIVFLVSVLLLPVFWPLQ